MHGAVLGRGHDRTVQIHVLDVLADLERQPFYDLRSASGTTVDGRRIPARANGDGGSAAIGLHGARSEARGYERAGREEGLGHCYRLLVSLLWITIVR